MTHGPRDFLIGLTALAAIVGLIVLLLLFGELERVTSDRYQLTIYTDHANGLRTGSGVELHGVPIGAIETVNTNRGEFPVRVTALIDPEVRIPRGATPYATISLLGGPGSLEIDVRAAPDPDDFLPTDGTAEIDEPIRIRPLEQLTNELDARMAPLLESLERFAALGDTFAQLGEQLDSLLEPQTPEAIAAGEAPNLRSAVARGYEVLDTAGQTLELARAWLDDDVIKRDARAAVSKAGTLIDEASATLERFQMLAGRLESNADKLVTALVPVTDDLSMTLEEVRRMTRLATEGTGTVSLLLNEPDLYRSLDDAARRLDQALRELTLFIEKVKAEGVPVQF